MRFGIRTKLLATLTLTGLLPLLICLAILLLAVVRLRTDTLGRSFAALAARQAQNLSTALEAEIDQLLLLNNLPETADFLQQRNARPPLTRQQIDEIEARWPELAPSDPLLSDILENSIARRWQAVQRHAPRVAEAIITDRSGRLVAASNLTTDYYQADEPWWQKCWDGGRGRVFIDNIGFDASAISLAGTPGALVADVCLPIFGGAPADGPEPLGIAKVSLRAQWLLETVMRPAGRQDLDADVWLVDAGGRPVAQTDAQSAPGSLPATLLSRLRAEGGGHCIEHLGSRKSVLGFARVAIPAIGGRSDLEWFVVVAGSHNQVIAPVYRLMWILILCGAIFTAACFLAGWLIAQKEILRPLLLLQQGVEQLARGNLSHRLPTPDRGASAFRADEIGRLAENFNQMAAQLQRQMHAVETANRLKSQFIDLASHELRTPITYILGVAQLAARHTGHNNAAIMHRIAHKAQRLCHIVENMFKLLESGDFDRRPRWTTVDLRGLIETIRVELEPFLQDRRQTLAVTLPDDLPVFVADAEKLRDILTNLLTNAIRFSPDGSEIRLEVSADAQAVEFCVIDQGSGVAPEDRQELFKPFFTGSRDLSLHSSGEMGYMTRGLGLGLSVVKRFVEMHGGTVVAEDAQPGMRFRVRLPRRGPGDVAERT